MMEFIRGINRSIYKFIYFSHLLAALFAFMRCTPSPDVVQEPPLQETKYFDNFTTDAVWAAVLLTIADLDFAIQKEIRESGFIFAQANTNPDPQYLPPHMNVHIREEKGRVRVNCHAVIPGQETNLRASSAIVKQFFTVLALHLIH